MVCGRAFYSIWMFVQFGGPYGVEQGLELMKEEIENNVVDCVADAKGYY